MTAPTTAKPTGSACCGAPPAGFAPRFHTTRADATKGRDVRILDDITRGDLISAADSPWRGFSDQVMGGISQETIVRRTALPEADG